MNIGETLKQLRENNNMTRREATNKLSELGIHISDKTLYGYESGRNSANADMFLALCQVYKCGNVMEIFSSSANDVLFTNNECQLIEKYRSLDQHGQELIDMVLDKEYQRVNRHGIKPEFYERDKPTDTSDLEALSKEELEMLKNGCNIKDKSSLAQNW